MEQTHSHEIVDMCFYTQVLQSKHELQNNQLQTARHTEIIFKHETTITLLNALRVLQTLGKKSINGAAHRIW